MVRNSLIALFLLVLVCIGVYAYWTAQVSRHRQKDLLSSFKKADSTIQVATDQVGKADPNFPEAGLAVTVAAITGCIDSMKHELVILSQQQHYDAASFSYPNKQRLQSLKSHLATLNQYVRSQYQGNRTIEKKDTLDIGDIRMGKATYSWESYYFENKRIFSIITQLTYIWSKTLELQHKLTH